MKNIYYDYNKADVRFTSFPELDKLVDFLNAKPDVVIELSAHTDSRGDNGYNLKLSQSRAESAMAYLILADVDPNRIIPKGYGVTRPVIQNAKTEEEHQANRRTE